MTNPCIDFVLLRLRANFLDVDAFDFTTDPLASANKIENFLMKYLQNFKRNDLIETSSKNDSEV